jgi:Ribbon-helix-helix protein, copG family
MKSLLFKRCKAAANIDYRVDYEWGLIYIVVIHRYSRVKHMVRTQIYLTEQERDALRAIANETGKTQSELIRQALDKLIGELDGGMRRRNLMAASGIWKDRNDLPDIRKLRREWERLPAARGK